MKYYKKQRATCLNLIIHIHISIQAENRITLLEEEKTEAEDVARDKTEELSETIGNKIVACLCQLFNPIFSEFQCPFDGFDFINRSF